MRSLTLDYLSQFSILISIKYINNALLINSILTEPTPPRTFIQLAIYIILGKREGDF